MAEGTAYCKHCEDVGKETEFNGNFELDLGYLNGPLAFALLGHHDQTHEDGMQNAHRTFFLTSNVGVGFVIAFAKRVIVSKDFVTVPGKS